MGYIDLKRKNFQTVNKVEKNFYHTRTLVNKTKLKNPLNSHYLITISLWRRT